MSRTRGQDSRQISASRLVLELCLSPITTIRPHRAASWRASSWRLDVAPHIVSKNSAFVHSFFALSTQSSQIFLVEVVCDTKLSGRSVRFSPSSSHFSRSFAPETTTGALHHPAMASTSGWSGVPTITGWRPRSSAWATISWMWVTLGQVASKTWIPLRAKPSWTARLSPWDRTITAHPLGTSSGLSTEQSPWAASRPITSWLWMMGPSMTQGPSWAAFSSASSTARRTP